MKNNKAFDEILGELWEDAVFNDRSYNALEKLVIEQSKKKDPADRNSLSLPLSEVYFSLTTSRNRNLITPTQQDQLRKTVVGFFGLSVGSHAALTWMMESRADGIKIADPDTIAPTNLNRLRYGWAEVGKTKVEVLERQLYQINPYSNIVSYVGTDIQRVKGLFDDTPKLKLVVDEIDDMQGKIFLRKFAKERKIPLISAVDVGDNVFLDVERYDINPQPKMFLDKLAGIENVEFSNLSDLERKKMIIKLVGFDKNSEEMLDSLNQLGKTLGTWPQLGATATIAGGVITTAIKKIVLGEHVKNGRYHVNLDEILDLSFNNIKRKKIRKNIIRQLKKKLNV